MIDPKKRFSKTISFYDAYRPSYPEKLVQWITKQTKLDRFSYIVDIGSGTGISSRLFSSKGYKVIGIEPNEEMLALARQKGGAIYQRGDASHTGLSDSFYDLIISAQAFHWFELNPTFRELRRILKPDGWCCAFWNTHEKNEFYKKYKELITEFSKDYSKISKPLKVIENIKESAIVKNISEEQFSNPQRFSLDRLIGYAYSNSYIAHGIQKHSLFRKRLMELFSSFQKNGQVDFNLNTIIICWQFID